MRVLLWDVDGTLVHAGGAGLRALAQTVVGSASALEALKKMRLDGMTDRGIARTLLAAARFGEDPERTLEQHRALVPEDEIDRVLRLYLDALRAGMRNPEGYRVLPGVLRTLDALEARGDNVPALATGNVEEGARAKLEHADLWRRFRFGGFGSDAEARPEILRAAWRRAEAHLATSLDSSAFVVVGDTPRDVEAAHATGMACVAIASGRHPAAELEACGAEVVLATLDCADAAEMIMGAVRR